MIGMNVMAGDVTFVPGDFPATDTKDFSATKDGVTVSVVASTVNADQIRVYKNKTITISSTAGNITKAVFTCTAEGTAKYGPGCFEDATAGSYAYDSYTGTWTGNAAEFTLTAKSNQVRITNLVVTIGGDVDARADTKIDFAEGYITRCTPGKDETVALPEATVMAGETAVVGATVTWTSSNEEVAPIVDGVIKPVNGNQGNVTITATYAGNDNFKGCSKNYTLKLYKGYAIFASLVEDLNSGNEKWDNGGELASFWMGELVNDEFKPAETLVTYASGKYTYLTDGTNHLLFYGTASVFGNSEQKLKAGDKITMDYGHGQGFDAIWGKAYRYNKLPEFSVEEMVVRVASENNEVAYAKIAATELANNVNKPVIIENAEYVSVDEKGKTFTFKVDETELTVYNQFGLATESLEAGAKYTLKGMGSVYNAVYQLYLVSFDKNGSTNITNMKAQNRFKGAIYNLNGQRITTPAKGLYIRDGKKFFVK